MPKWQGFRTVQETGASKTLYLKTPFDLLGLKGQDQVYVKIEEINGKEVIIIEPIK